MTHFMPTAQDAAADAALALELVGDYFAGQIDAGAVLKEEIARHIHGVAAAIAEEHPAYAARVESRAAEIVARMPDGWAGGDWQDPA